MKKSENRNGKGPRPIRKEPNMPTLLVAVDVHSRAILGWWVEPRS